MFPRLQLPPKLSTKTIATAICVSIISTNLFAYDIRALLDGTEPTKKSEEPNKEQVQQQSPSTIDSSQSINKENSTEQPTLLVPPAQVNMPKPRIEEQPMPVVKPKPTNLEVQSIEEIKGKNTDISNNEAQELQDVQFIMQQTQSILNSTSSNQFTSATEQVSISMLYSALTQTAMEQYYRISSTSTQNQLTQAIGCINKQNNPELSVLATSMIKQFNQKLNTFNAVQNSPAIGSNYTSACS